MKENILDWIFKKIVLPIIVPPSNSIKVSEEFSNIYEQIYEKNKNVKEKDKQKVFRSEILKLIDGKFEYSDEGLNIYEAKYKKAFRTNSLEHVEFCENYISGKLLDYISMDVMDILFLNTPNLQRKPVAGFYGTFAYITLNCNVNGKIILERDTGVDECKYSDNTKILTDSIEFEKQFDLYCENRNFALQIFTIDVIEDILKFLKESEIDFEMTIIDNEIYFRFFSRYMLRMLNKSPSNRSALYQYYLILKFIVNLTEKINNKIKELE